MTFFRFFLTMLLFTSCALGETKREHKEGVKEDTRKKVLCTTALIGNIVEAVGKDVVQVTSLITGEHDPHSYRLVKGDDEKFAEADLIFYNGLGLEHGPSLKAILEKSPKAHSLGSFLEKTTPSKLLRVDQVYDPHVWMDIKLWAECVPFIEEKLIELVPDAKEAIIQNARALSQKMHLAHEQIVAGFQAIPDTRRYLVTTHDAFQYFARAYLANEQERENGSWTERVAAPEGLAPESQLSTVDIVHVVNYMIRHDVHVLFAESNVSRDSIRKIMDAARKQGFQVSIAEAPLFADSMGKAGSQASDYLGMMLYDAEAIQNEMQK